MSDSCGRKYINCSKVVSQASWIGIGWMNGRLSRNRMNHVFFLTESKKYFIFDKKQNGFYILIAHLSRFMDP
jgi:hypothetical protein